MLLKTPVNMQSQLPTPSSGLQRSDHGGALNTGSRAKLRPFKAATKSPKVRKAGSCRASGLNGSGPSSDGSHESASQDESTSRDIREKSLDDRILSGEVSAAPGHRYY